MHSEGDILWLFPHVSTDFLLIKCNYMGTRLCEALNQTHSTGQWARNRPFPFQFLASSTLFTLLIFQFQQLNVTGEHVASLRCHWHCAKHQQRHASCFHIQSQLSAVIITVSPASEQYACVIVWVCAPCCIFQTFIQIWLYMLLLLERLWDLSLWKQSHRYIAPCTYTYCSDS